MSDLEILKQNKPAVAELVEQWRAKYNKTFDLTDPSQQADFYEGLVELGRHMASASVFGTLNAEVSVDGVCGLTITARPHSP